jgi:hypothetical protein
VQRGAEPDRRTSEALAVRGVWGVCGRVRKETQGLAGARMRGAVTKSCDVNSEEVARWEKGDAKEGTCV